ncbi:MAG TPA: hypothetical protein VFA18_20915 [Gemmataceae bacterium]|nr:hypothetical protein [Gemmataceae bacterium]
MPRAIPNPDALPARAPRTQIGDDQAHGSSRPSASGRAAFLMEPVSGMESPLLSAGVGQLLRNGDSTDPQALQAEIARLREVIAQLEKELTTNSTGDSDWQQRQREYESLLEEKSELIRNLHLKIRELEQQPAPKPPPNEDELVAMSEQLERDRNQLQQERKQLDDDLRQFKEDEETMTRQMREMEVQMARERAELARQRTEVQRMLEELRHELERYERDQGLNDRLGMLRQRYHEVSSRRTPVPSRTPPAEPETPNRAQSAQPAKSNGLLGRLFGQGK